MNRKALLAISCALASATTYAAPPRAATKGSTETDKLEAAAEQIARMKASLKQVLGRVEEARNEKDVVKLNCVNEKLTQIKTLLKVAERADAALREAVAKRDPGAASEFVKIGIARSKVEVLRGQSEQCIGQLAYVVDEKTTVEVQQPPLPEGGDGDERERGRRGPPFPAPPIVRPPPASLWY